MIIGLVAACFLASQAFSGVLIEPGVGMAFSGEYETSGTLNGNDASGTADMDNNPVGINLRLGYKMIGFWGAFDYSLVSSFGVENSTTDVDITSGFLTVGFDFPIMLRVWAGYALMGDADYGVGKYEGISGTKFGVGYSGLPFISINAEMYALSFDEVTSGGVTITTLEADFNYYLLSVSVPFDL